MGMVGHLFQNCDTIDVRFFATYTCDLSCFVGFSPSMWPFSSQTRTYMRTTRAHIYAIKASMYGVTESRRIRATELYRQQKHPFVYDRAEK